MAPNRILLIDSYDSFTHNLSALCLKAIPSCTVHIVKNDEITAENLPKILPHFDAIVVGPGPGSPAKDEDINIVKHLWTVSDDVLLPIFGVCLGLQSMAIEHGAILKQLNVVKHGQLSRLEILDNARRGGGLFEGVNGVHAVRYHSLHVHLLEDGPIEALAYANDGVENGRVVMAARHKVRPFWAVQYHPESACTEGGGVEVIRNFWKLACSWSEKRERHPRPWNVTVQKLCPNIWPSPLVMQPSFSGAQTPLTVETSILDGEGIDTVSVCEMLGAQDESSPFVLLDSAANPGRFSILGCLEAPSERITFHLGDPFLTLTRGSECLSVPLKSGDDIWSWISRYMKGRQAQGGHAAIPFWGGLVGYLSYELGVHEIGVALPAVPEGSREHPDVNLVFVERSVVIDKISKRIYVQSIRLNDSQWIAETARTLRKASWLDSVPSEIPSTPASGRLLRALHPPPKSAYISGINKCKDYLASGDSYELCLTGRTHFRIVPPPGPVSQARLHPHLVSDSSKPALSSSSWRLYRLLRGSNPAPYSAYLRLSPSTVLSSSPERFLSFARPSSNQPYSSSSESSQPSPSGTPFTQNFQLRPIKGTLRKSASVNRAEAERCLRGSPKEVAENLMIVDLIRHDLYGVVGPQVDVKQFCAIEEYETVWQMVSVIEGSALLRSPSPSECEGTANVQNGPLPQGIDFGKGLGWEVLRRSLPPGSMTGAPKKRSVEILQRVESEVSTDSPSSTTPTRSGNGARGIYSGVLGYWDAGGGGDWSVVIRSCFKYDGSGGGALSSPSPALDIPAVPITNSEEHTEEWVVGAGGAITALSDAEAEWEEMHVKLQSLLRAFGGTVSTPSIPTPST